MPSDRPRPEDHVIVIFGITGDLARRKIIPGLYHLAAAGLLPTNYRIVGCARRSSKMSDDELRAYAYDATCQFATEKPDEDGWHAFAENLLAAVDPDDGPDGLSAVMERAEAAIGGEPRRLYHLAIPPDAMRQVIELLGQKGLNERGRIICEKPFGTDLASARELNQEISRHFDESQVFRIDHFLGKESIDNILALRFANELFEPLWRRNHVRYVQIDVPEVLSIEGRGAFYEETGAFKDMVVTHLFQVLGQIAMEQPTSLTAKPLRDEVSKVFETMRPLDPREVVRGQYEGYRDEDGVAKDSTTETFIALRAWVDNARWMGVPFYLRTGKRMAQSRQIITLGLREPVMEIFPELKANPNRDSNKLIIDFKDPGSIHAEFLAKQPGPTMVLGTARMHFHYRESFQISNNLEAYERLLMEVMLGNQALFTRSDGIERLWEVSAPVLESPPPIEFYPQGTWGPYSIERIISPHRWTLPQ
ncbi:MAG TPA: glucose-6-phosphate dehydrogenase [Acidimicrobiales bacterium]|nr:MAG: glucose-6-phosphate dehydrogenase [Actinobacteria bacterium 21-73-9]HQU25390.1 glucose-6-phosphate dehydrogenase [Acidimicrobiales bacterium]